MSILPNIRRLIAGSLIPRAVLRPALYRCVCVRQRRICKGLVKRQQRLSAGRTADGRCPLRQLAYAELEYYLQPLRQENRKFKSVGTLMGIYYKPVGGSAPLLLNVSPSKNGVIPLIDTLHMQGLRRPHPRGVLRFRRAERYDWQQREPAVKRRFERTAHRGFLKRFLWRQCIHPRLPDGRQAAGQQRRAKIFFY